jgi:hypothetical protein
MGQALLGFLGVILGAAIAGVISLWQVQSVTKREREARQALREQEQKDRRDAFQREVLLAVQDAVNDVQVAVWRERERRITAVHAGEPWPNLPGPGLPLPEDWNDADSQVNKLAARVFDSELSGLLDDFQGVEVLAMTAENRDTMTERIKAMNGLGRKINQRISILLPELF